MAKLYEVIWKDHFSDSAWKEKSEIEEWVKERLKKPCTTVGYIVYETDEIIVMSASDDGEENRGDLMAIFKVCVIKRKLIRRK